MEDSRCVHEWLGLPCEPPGAMICAVVRLDVVGLIVSDLERAIPFATAAVTYGVPPTARSLALTGSSTALGDASMAHACPATQLSDASLPGLGNFLLARAGIVGG
jgi:hypothetical protein